MSNYGIGVSGLRANSTAIDVISTNIANAATVGYKAGEFLFQDQFFKALNPMDPARAGQGALQQNIRRLFNMGSIQDSANTLDMAITGANGMFQVASSTNPKEIYYTRNGQFAVSAEQDAQNRNYIVNENGMYLTGYASTNGVTIDDGDSLNKLTMPPTELEPITTTNSEISVTLDARTNAFLTSGNVQFNPLVPSTYHHKVSQTVFSREDNGGEHTLTLYYRRVQDKEMEISYDSSSQQFYYPASQVAHQFGSSDANNVYLTADTSAGIEFLTAPGRATRLDDTFAAGDTSMDISVTTSINQWARVIINGVDSGKVVTAQPASGDSEVTLSATPALSVGYDAGTEVKFYNPAGIYENDTATAVAHSTATVDGETVSVLTLPIAEVTFPNTISVGQYLWLSPDLADPAQEPRATGARILSVDSTTGAITLDKDISADEPDIETSGASFIFYDPISYSLTAQDGSKVVMKGDAYNATSNQKFYAVTTQYEVYGLR